MSCNFKMKSKDIVTYFLWLHATTIVMSVCMANFMFGPIDFDDFFNISSFDYFLLPILMGFFIGPFGCAIAYIILKIFKKRAIFSFCLSLFFSLLINAGLLYVVNSVLVGG